MRRSPSCATGDASASTVAWRSSPTPAPRSTIALSNDIDDETAAAGRPHLARALVAKGHAIDVQDAFDRWLKPGRPGYVAKRGYGPKAAIEAIRAAGGIAVLAHSPGALDGDRPASGHSATGACTASRSTTTAGTAPATRPGVAHPGDGRGRRTLGPARDRRVATTMATA